MKQKPRKCQFCLKGVPEVGLYYMSRFVSCNQCMVKALEGYETTELRKDLRKEDNLRGWWA